MLLSGKDVAEFVKQRHYEETRSLGFAPKLAIIMSNQADKATQSYVRSSKGRYGGDVGVEVEVYEVEGETAKVIALIERLNKDSQTDAMIVQLPFEGVDVDEVLAAVAPEKDVDGLGPNPQFDPATPKGILWILGSYNIEWKGKTVAVVGQGRLVGKPLSKMLEDSGATVIRCNSKSDLKAETLKSDIVVSAVGKPGLIGPGMVRPGTVVIDAGTADLGGSVVGDVDKALYDDETLKVTPNPGGVGPVTVAALFDNVILAAKKRSR